MTLGGGEDWLMTIHYVSFGEVCEVIRRVGGNVTAALRLLFPSMLSYRKTRVGSCYRVTLPNRWSK